ncbi:MAG TPA: hypothetical protein VMT99_03660 [Candidatus Paceibacterota bacterium]|nr:hypothetical protein [Candidatus Paceibacterota bacterium]
MDKLSATSKVIIIAVVVCLVIFAIFLYGGPKTSSAPASPSPAGSAETAATAGTETSSVTTSTLPTTQGTGSSKPVSGSAPKPVTKPQNAIKIITPVSGDEWKIGVTNPVSWTPEANFTGEIDLVDAKTGTVIGVILSETGPHQTSYGWNTREISLNRYSPLKKEVAAGTYKVRMKFDGNNLPTITSPTFTITN